MNRNIARAAAIAAVTGAAWLAAAHAAYADTNCAPAQVACVGDVSAGPLAEVNDIFDVNF